MYIINTNDIFFICEYIHMMYSIFWFFSWAFSCSCTYRYSHIKVSLNHHVYTLHIYFLKTLPWYLFVLPSHTYTWHIHDFSFHSDMHMYAQVISLFHFCAYTFHMAYFQKNSRICSCPHVYMYTHIIFAFYFYTYTWHIQKLLISCLSFVVLLYAYLSAHYILTVSLHKYVTFSIFSRCLSFFCVHTSHAHTHIHTHKRG